MHPAPRRRSIWAWRSTTAPTITCTLHKPPQLRLRSRAWAQQPVWTPAPFNAVNSDGTPITPPSPFQIVKVFLGEATDQEYVVVDIVRDPGQSADFVTRYYIDTTTQTAPKWTPHDLAVDVEAVSDDSCLGRSDGAYGVDGIYTKGFVGVRGAADLHAGRQRVRPHDAGPAVAAQPSQRPRRGRDRRRPQRRQHVRSLRGLPGRPLLVRQQQPARRGHRDALLSRPLHCSMPCERCTRLTTDDSVSRLGLNGNEIPVSHLTRPLGQQGTGSAWNVPLTILTGVDAISPFVDRNYSANTFFAHSGNGSGQGGQVAHYQPVEHPQHHAPAECHNATGDPHPLLHDPYPGHRQQRGSRRRTFRSR